MHIIRVLSRKDARGAKGALMYIIACYVPIISITFRTDDCIELYKNEKLKHCHVHDHQHFPWLTGSPVAFLGNEIQLCLVCDLELNKMVTKSTFTVAIARCLLLCWNFLSYLQTDIIFLVNMQIGFSIFSARCLWE